MQINLVPHTRPNPAKIPKKANIVAGFVIVKKKVEIKLLITPLLLTFASSFAGFESKDFTPKYTKKKIRQLISIKTPAPLKKRKLLLIQSQL